MLGTLQKTQHTSWLSLAEILLPSSHCTDHVPGMFVTCFAPTNSFTPQNKPLWWALILPPLYSIGHCEAERLSHQPEIIQQVTGEPAVLELEPFTITALPHYLRPRCPWHKADTHQCSINTGFTGRPLVPQFTLQFHVSDSLSAAYGRISCMRSEIHGFFSQWVIIILCIWTMLYIFFKCQQITSLPNTNLRMFLEGK